MPRTLLDDGRLLAQVCLGTALLSLGCGMMAPISSLWLQDTGHSPTLIGLNTACYYLGTVVAAGLVPVLMRRRARVSIVGGLVAMGGSVAAFPWVRCTALLFGLRAVTGLATAATLVPLETLHSTHSRPSWRARTLGLYALMVALGAAAGMSLGTLLYAHDATCAFLASGAATVIAAIQFARVLPADLRMAEPTRASSPVRPWRHPLSLCCSWCEGFLEGVLFFMLPVYLRAVGYREGAAGLMASLSVVGGIGAQVPLAWLADRIGRRQVVVGCLLATAVELWLIPLGAQSAGLGVLLAMVGASGTALYPLGLAVLSERVPPADRAQAGAWFLAVNCLGSVVGPAVTGVAMDGLGPSAALLIAAGMVTAVVAVAVGQCLVAVRVPRVQDRWTVAEEAVAGLSGRPAACRRESDSTLMARSRPATSCLLCGQGAADGDTSLSSPSPLRR